MGLIQEHKRLESQLDAIDKSLTQLIRDIQQLVEDITFISKTFYELFPVPVLLSCPRCGRQYTRFENEAVWHGGKCGLCL